MAVDDPNLGRFRTIQAGPQVLASSVWRSRLMRHANRWAAGLSRRQFLDWLTFEVVRRLSGSVAAAEMMVLKKIAERGVSLGLQRD